MITFDDNVALSMADEHVEQEGFTIDNDNKAEWAIRKIDEERAEAQRYINVCNTMINEYRLKIQEAEEQLERDTGYLQSLLAQYFETVETKRTKTQETYKLPSGTLKKKYPQPQFKRDDEKLVKWLKDRQMNEYIKVKEYPDWSNLKKALKLTKDNVLVDENGEIVDGVLVVERPPVFEVEV
jgi:hypothetical protein